jgi:RNA polymerase sigma-70 factor (ECF subfamily)
MVQVPSREEDQAAGQRCGSAADRHLVARLAAGDPDALAEVYRQFSGLVFGLARRVLKEQSLAEDVTQEVFVFLWQHPERFDPSRGTLRTWLALLAHRRSVDRLRSEVRRSQAEARAEIDAATAPVAAEADDVVTAAWLSGRVQEALSKLPAEQRDAVVLAYFGGRTYRQVATELAIPEGTAKSRLRLALGRLDELLRCDYIDEAARAWT